jgi:DNA-binding XRE family transcriptional regulator
MQFARSLCDVTATSDALGHATHATSEPLLDFDVIKERAGEILKIDEITDEALGEMFGLSRETIWHYRHGKMKPRFETVSAMADKLGLSVDEIRAQGNPSTPRPASPGKAVRP